MPTYQYACTECDHRFEAVQSFHDAALTECPECTGRLRKLFSSVGIVFKGSGFYRTDSRGSGASKSDAGTGDAGSAKGDSAPKDGATPKKDAAPAAAASTGSSTASSSAKKESAA
ncbi:MAG: FmdB family transcriptional regulator [Actinomycetota bacterium]|nr:FmdB family transcriptional regulator [Actinomycetota bacterium]